MDLSPSVLGAGVVAKLNDRRTAWILKIGRDGFTRSQLAGVGCFNFQAAATLSAILNKELNVKDTRDVFERIPPAALALPRLGAIAIAVLGAAFEAKGIGGEAPLVAWVRKHAGAPDATVHTFVSLKVRDAKERAEGRTADRKRSAARQSKAQRLKRDRFLARAEAAK
jgi:hypothetical protein